MNPRSPGISREAPLVSLVFPAYNPGPSIDQTCREVAQFLRTASGNWEILFVCDGCTDGTVARLRALTASEPRVQVLSYTPNRGKGYAVRHGLEAATGAYRLYTDV